MNKDKYTRRDFLKMTLLGLGAGVLAACKQAVKPLSNVVATITATSSKTNTPTSTNTPAATPTETLTPTPTDIPCFRLLSPENGAQLPVVGKVTFSWEVLLAATRYQLQITFPNGQVVSLDSNNANNTRYIESFLAGGVYTWKVIALDNNGKVICTTEPFTFEKPAYDPPSQNNGGGDDGGGGTTGNTTGSVVGSTVGD